jgi:hypothetical protein
VGQFGVEVSGAGKARESAINAVRQTILQLQAYSNNTTSDLSPMIARLRLRPSLDLVVAHGIVLAFVLLFSADAAAAPSARHEIQHVIVHRPEPGGYAGWPANYGMWAWGNEFVLGFTEGHHDASGGFHARSRKKPFATKQARSVDGGVTWKTDLFPGRTPGGRGLSADEHMDPELWVANMLKGDEAPKPAPGTVDFTHPDFALMCARTNLKVGATSWFYLSVDRCRSWLGPYALPMFDQKGIAARTDYLVSGPKELMLFLTSTKANGDEGRVFCTRTTDGGKTFRFVSWLGEEPPGFEIMPASLRLSPTRIITAVRSRSVPEGPNRTARNWMDLYLSEDNGASWTKTEPPVATTGTGGNPPTLVRLKDGRFCMTYGYRDKPFGIRAKLSSDGGRTWGQEIVLRDDAGSHDIGYPRTLQRADGKMVTAYYFNDRQGSAGYIAATIWKP